MKEQTDNCDRVGCLEDDGVKIIAAVFVCICLVGALQTSAATAQVKAEPRVLTFNTLDQEHKVRLSAGGRDISVKSCKLLAGDHDYDHMISCTGKGGTVTVKPTGRLEIGTYDLVINTSAGKALVRINAPLDGLLNDLERLARSEGVPVDAIKQRLGLVTSAPHPRLALELPQTSCLGQVLEVSIKNVLGHSYEWSVNGETVVEGPHANTLRYTFKEPGRYVVTCTEIKNGRVVASESADTQVVMEDVIDWAISVNTTIKAAGPEGFTKYAWRIDGETVSNDDVLEHKFRDPGEYLIECSASAPVEGPEGGFRHIRYALTVTKN